MTNLKLFEVIFCGAALVAFSYMRTAYAEIFRRARSFGTLQSMVLAVIFTWGAYFLWSNQVPIWYVAFTLMLCLTFLSVAVREFRKLLADDRDVFAWERGEALSTLPEGESALRFGPHELFIEPGRIRIRRRYTLRDIAGHLFWPACLAVLVFGGWKSEAAYYCLAVFTLIALGTIAGEHANSLRLRPLFEIRNDEIHAGRKQFGKAADAQVDAKRIGGRPAVRLIDPKFPIPYVLVTTSGNSLEQAEEIAASIRKFLRERQQEQVWPPAPEEVNGC